MLTRTAQELFSPVTIASYEGKPIVIGRDSSDWSSIAKGAHTTSGGERA